ncbi:hypothetical protein LCGC14_1415430 [marine sediment metagenome]|uniref:Uncharacterized protein n=1 Tax=marine sediment metagenome TaxID=412755 RepID=A0A0F9MUQ1_9ZZZZ
MTKKKLQPITTIEKGRVRISRKGWAAFVADTDDVLGLDLSNIEAGNGPVTLALEAHLFLLSVIKAAQEYAAYSRGGDGCDCDELCSGFGGCDFSYGSIFVCNEGDLFVCPRSS